MSMTARAWECVAIDLNGVGVRGRAGGALGPWCGSLAGKIDEASKLGRWVRGPRVPIRSKKTVLAGENRQGSGPAVPEITGEGSRPGYRHTCKLSGLHP